MNRVSEVESKTAGLAFEGSKSFKRARENAARAVVQSMAKRGISRARNSYFRFVYRVKKIISRPELRSNRSKRKARKLSHTHNQRERGGGGKFV